MDVLGQTQNRRGTFASKRALRHYTPRKPLIELGKSRYVRRNVRIFSRITTLQTAGMEELPDPFERAGADEMPDGQERAGSDEMPVAIERAEKREMSGIHERADVEEMPSKTERAVVLETPVLSERPHA